MVGNRTAFAKPDVVDEEDAAGHLLMHHGRGANQLLEHFNGAPASVVAASRVVAKAGALHGEGDRTFDGTVVGAADGSRNRAVQSE